MKVTSRSKQYYGRTRRRGRVAEPALRTQTADLSEGNHIRIVFVVLPLIIIDVVTRWYITRRRKEDSVWWYETPVLLLLFLMITVSIVLKTNKQRKWLYLVSFALKWSSTTTNYEERRIFPVRRDWSVEINKRARARLLARARTPRSKN